jgi:hypothetical protein
MIQPIGPTGSSLANLPAVTQYGGVATAGPGIRTIRATGRATAQAGAAAAIATFTPAADGSFEVSANVLVTTATVHAFGVTCTYTDEGNTARSLILPFVLVAGAAIAVSVANAVGAVPYIGLPCRIRAKGGTAITIQSAGTFTTVVYNVEATIEQVA